MKAKPTHKNPKARAAGRTEGSQQRVVRALIGKPVWLRGETTPKYIHNIEFGLTDKKYDGQPSGMVWHTPANMVSFQRPNAGTEAQAVDGNPRKENDVR